MKIITIALLLMLASLTHASPLPDYPFVFARGEIQEDLAPTTCKVAYEIKVRDKDSANGIRTVESRAAETLDLLYKHGIKKEDILGYEVNKEVVRNYENRDQLEFIGYEIRRQIVFTLRELQNYEPIVSVLLETPDVTDIRTSFDRDDRKEIETRMMAGAVSDAKKKAELMAEGSGQRIVRLRAISQQGFYNLTESFGLGNVEYDGTMYSVHSEPETELLFIPSTIEFRSSITVIYEIEENK